MSSDGFDFNVMGDEFSVSKEIKAAVQSAGIEAEKMLEEVAGMLPGPETPVPHGTRMMLLALEKLAKCQSVIDSAKAIMLNNIIGAYNAGKIEASVLVRQLHRIGSVIEEKFTYCQQFVNFAKEIDNEPE